MECILISIWTYFYFHILIVLLVLLQKNVFHFCYCYCTNCTHFECEFEYFFTIWELNTVLLFSICIILSTCRWTITNSTYMYKSSIQLKAKRNEWKTEKLYCRIFTLNEYDARIEIREEKKRRSKTMSPSTTK